MMSDDRGPEPDDGAVLAVLAAVKSAVPTSRHAEMLVDAVAAGIGEEAVIETACEGEMIRIFRRDRSPGVGIIPWPILRFARGRRLGFVMGDGPPTDATPEAVGGPPLRLSGLSSGELEVGDGRMSITITYGKDGRLAEMSHGGLPAGFAGLDQEIARGTGHAVESLVDRIVAGDPGCLGPGRILRPEPCPATIESAWRQGLVAMRDAILEARVAPGARFAAVDGFAGEVLCFGATREETIERTRGEIGRRKPRPPDPTPPPTLSPETLEKLGMEEGPFLLSAPPPDLPDVAPHPSNTPIAHVELPPPPAAPPPLGTWIRLLDDQGGSTFVAMREDPQGRTFLSQAALALVDLARLDELLADAEREGEEWLDDLVARDWPAELPPLDSFLLHFSLERTDSGELEARVTGSHQTHGFQGRLLRAESLGNGILRQRWTHP